MRDLTTPQAAGLLGVAESTLRKHARILGIQRIGRDYILTSAQIQALRQSLASSKRGRPTRAMLEVTVGIGEYLGVTHHHKQR